MNWRVISWLGMLLYAGRGWASEPPIPYDGAGHILFRRGAPCGVKVGWPVFVLVLSVDSIRRC